MKLSLNVQVLYSLWVLITMLVKGKRAEKGGFEMGEKNIYVRVFNGKKGEHIVKEWELE